MNRSNKCLCVGLCLMSMSRKYIPALCQLRKMTFKFRIKIMDSNFNKEKTKKLNRFEN